MKLVTSDAITALMLQMAASDNKIHQVTKHFWIFLL